MKINVLVKPRSKQARVEKINNENYKVSLSFPAKNNKANKQLIDVLAAYFKVPKSSIIIKGGLKNKQKVILVIE